VLNAWAILLEIPCADYSSVKAPGEYRLELDTVVSGDSFPIRKDAYDNALLLTMRSFYGQRCGFDVNLGGGYAHPKCHMEAAGYKNSLPLEDYGGASNSIVANHSLLLLIANQFEPDRSYTNCALNDLHYLLGRNCLGISWVTQLGSRPLQHPHHRPSVADNIVAPWPGLLSNGPNTDPADPITKALPRQAPMRMYVDDERAYSSNEPIISCNAPLVFILATLHTQ